MSTDGFPTVELSQEISQSTFVEVISADEVTTRAFRSQLMTVPDAARRLAFGGGTNAPIPPDPTPPPQVVYSPTHPLRLSAVPINPPEEQSASFPILDNALFEPEDAELVLTAVADFDFTDTSYPLSNFRSFSTSDGSTSNMWKSIVTQGKTVSPLPRSAPTDVRMLAFKLAPLGSTTFNVAGLSITNAKLSLSTTVSTFLNNLLYQGYVLQWVIGFVDTRNATPYANMLPIAGGLLDPSQNLGTNWLEGVGPFSGSTAIPIANTVNTVGAPDPSSFLHLRNKYKLVYHPSGNTIDHIPIVENVEYDGTVISGTVATGSVSPRPTDNAMVIVIKEQKLNGTQYVNGTTVNLWDMPVESQIGNLLVTLNAARTCGEVFTNLVTNSDLSTGTTGWQYSTGTVLESNIPTTAWDSTLHAIILDSSTGPTTIQNADTDIDCSAYIGKLLNVTFDIASFTGTSMSLGSPNGTYDATTTALQCNIIDKHTDAVVATKLFYLMDITYPSKRNVPFTVPPSGEVKIQFVINPPSGRHAGVAKFTNVMCCAPTDNSPAGMEQIAQYDRFYECPFATGGGIPVVSIDSSGTVHNASIITLGDNIIPIRQGDYLTVSFLVKPRELSPNVSAPKLNDAIWPNNLPGRVKVLAQSITKFCNPYCFGGTPVTSSVFVFDRNPGIKTFTIQCVSDGGISMTITDTDVTGGQLALGNIVGGAVDTRYLDKGPPYGPESAMASDIIVNATSQTGCSAGVIRDVTCSLSWKGIPRRPFNIYNLFARVKLRYPTSPTTVSTQHALPGQQTHWGGLGNSLWKIQDPSTSTYSYIVNYTTYNGIVECAPLRTGLGIDPGGSQFYDGPIAKAPIDTYCTQVNQGDVVDVTGKTNFIWAVPYLTDGVVNDYFTTEFTIQPAQPFSGNIYVIESITFFMLSQLVNPAGTSDDSLHTGPFDHGPDPAEQFQVALNYTNSLGEAKQFVAEFNADQLFQQTEYYPAGTLPWDSVSGTGNGVRGQHARWDAAEFVLDNISGTGLDQCTPPIIVNFTGSGDLKFNSYVQSTTLLNRKTFDLAGRGKTAPPCSPSVEVTVVATGASSNEVQAVDLPAHVTGGTFNLSLTMNGQTNVATFDYNVTADDMRTNLATMPLINTVDNVLVTLAGSTYVVTFVGALESTNIPLMVGDGSNLAGSASAMITKITTGTANERQTISKTTNTTADLVLSYGSQVTAPIPYNSTPAAVQTIIEGVVGNGNVLVTGSTGSPWVVDFVGTLAGQSVFLLQSTVVGYKVTRNWAGGTGVNDVQQITVSATGGTMDLVVTSQDGTQTRTLTGIAYNISAAQLQAIISGISFIGAGNVGVSLDATGTIYTIEFKGSLAKLPMPIITMSANNLTGGRVTVVELTSGSGASAQQMVRVINGTSGFYTLTIPIGSNQYITPNIPYDANTGVLQSKIINCGAFTSGETVTVTAIPGSTLLNRQFLVTFDPRTGVVGQMLPNYTGTLICQNQAGGGGPDPVPQCYPTITIVSLPGLGNEIQAITIPSSVVSGTWTITASINGVSSQTAALAYNATASEVQTALASLVIIGDGNVTVSKNGHTYTVEFIGTLSGTPVHLMTADGSQLVVNSAITLTNAGYYVLLDVTNGTGTNAILYSNQSTVFVGWNAIAYQIDAFYFENECVGLVQFSLNCPYGATVDPVILTFNFDTTIYPAWGDVRGVVLSQSDWPTDIADARSKQFYDTKVPFIFSDWEGGINGGIDITAIVQDYVNDTNWTPGSKILIYLVPDSSGTQYGWDSYVANDYEASLGTKISNIGFSNPNINTSQSLDATVTVTRHSAPVINQQDHWQFDSAPTYPPGTLLYFKREDRSGAFGTEATRYSAAFEPKEFSTSGHVPLNTVITNALNNMLGNNIVTVTGDLLDPAVGLTVEYENQALVQGFFGDNEDSTKMSQYNYPITLHIWDINHADLVTSPLPTLTHPRTASGYNQIQKLTLNTPPSDITQCFVEITVPLAYGVGETNATTPHPVTFTAGPFTFSNGICDQSAFQMAQMISASAFNANLIAYDPNNPHATDAIANATFSDNTNPTLLNNAHWSVAQPVSFEFVHRNYQFTENELMVLKSSDSATINGTHLYFIELSLGGNAHQYSMQIEDGDAGYYVLMMSIGSTIYTSSHIAYNADAAAIRSAILASGIPTSVYVAARPGSRHRHLLFNVGFGSSTPPVTLTPVYLDTLECIPDTTPVTDPADPGPYTYTPELSSISCQTGDRFRKADPLNDPDPPRVMCCTPNSVRSTADVSTRIVVQRDLVDPSQFGTVRGLAARAGLQISKYTPYTRDFATNTLTQVAYATPVKSKMSVVFISNSIVNGKDKVSSYLASSKEILPARNTVLA